MKYLIILITIVNLCLISNMALAFEWTLDKKVRATQTQRQGQALFIYTTGFWFASSHRCSEKAVILLEPDVNGSEGFDQMFSQVLMAHASGKSVIFGAGVDDCEDGTENALFRADFIQVID